MSETRPAWAKTAVSRHAGRKALILGPNPGTTTTTRKATLPCLQGDGNDRTSDQPRVDEGPLPLLRSDRGYVARHGPNPPPPPPGSLETRPRGTNSANMCRNAYTRAGRLSLRVSLRHGPFKRTPAAGPKLRYPMSAIAAQPTRARHDMPDARRLRDQPLSFRQA
jgi:hypothetical protein